jgi:hypothetical protein
MGRHAGQTPGRRLAVILGLAVLTVSMGCADAGPPDPEPDAIDHVDDSPDVAEATVTPRPGMLDVEPVRIWFEYGRVDEHTMLLTFPSQGPPCEVLDRIEVDETDTRLTITLYQGRDPESDPNEACDGRLDRVFDVEVPLSRPFELEVDVLINGGSLTDRTDIESMIIPRPGMLDVVAVPWWYEYGSGDAPDTMTVIYASKGPPCEVLDRVEVDEAGAKPVITLYQGRDPDADPTDPCDGPTQVVGVDVALSRDPGPVDGRYTLAGITAENGDGPVINGGR